MTPNVQFFYDHAGFSYDPKKETPEAGRLRCAQDLATAEEFARSLDWAYQWIDDECIGCDCGSDECACCTGENHESLCCVLYGAWQGSHVRPTGREVLASLGGICGATSEYRRVVEAELASEAMVNYLECVKMMAP